MTDSNFPSNLDDDNIIPHVDNNITEVGGDAINGARSAIFNIEETLGIDPQGTASTVSDRLDVSLNSDGTIKASALASAGLVSLPITNSMIASNADIAESKLGLDYTTSSLNTLIAILRADVVYLDSLVQADITNLLKHSSHPATWGRHRTSDVDGYYGKFSSHNLQGIITTIDDSIVNHMADSVGAHNASAVFFNDANTFISAIDVQSAIEELDNIGLTTIESHQDEQHSNGILFSQKTNRNGTSFGPIVTQSASIANFSIGAKNITYNALPSTLSNAKRGDTVVISVGLTTYQRTIDYVSTSGTGKVYFFEPMTVSSTSATATIYETQEEQIAPSAFALAITKENALGGGSIIQVVHPGSPYVLSNGLDARKFTNLVKNLKFSWASGYTSNIDCYSLLQTYPYSNTSPSTWTCENLAIALNYEFKSKKYPLIAFSYRGEIGVAYDQPDGYLQCLSTSSPGWSALGLAGTEIAYAKDYRRSYINGKKLTDFYKLEFSCNVESNIVKDSSINFSTSGISSPGVVRLNNIDDYGTYVFTSNTNTTLTVYDHTFSGTDVSGDGYVYFDNFSDQPYYKTLYEIVLDEFNEKLAVRGLKRLEYFKSVSSSASFEEYIDIIDVSRNFSTSLNYRVAYDSSTGGIQLGIRGSGTSVSNGGAAYQMPTTNVVGHKFRLYAENNFDYIECVVIRDYTLLTLTNSIDVNVFSRSSEENYIQIGKVLHDTNKFKYLKDERLFGTVGRKDVRDDYTRDYITYPISKLRGNGIVFGMSCDGAGTNQLTVDGGSVLVNGILYDIPATTFSVPKETSSSFLTYNLFVSDDGVVNFLQDDFSSQNLSTPSTNEIIKSNDKVLLAVVTVSVSNLITYIYDCRLFVNNLDNHLDMVVDGYNTGSFVDLKSAINYVNLSGIIGHSMKIVIKGTIERDASTPIYLPDGVKISGDSFNTNEAEKGSKIKLTGSGTYFMYLGDCALENITIDASEATLSAVFNSNSTPSIMFSNCRIQSPWPVFDGTYTKSKFTDCVFTDASSTANYIFDCTSLTNCIFENNICENIKGLVDCTTLTNCVFSKNYCTFAGTTSNRNYINCTTSSKCFYLNNSFASSGNLGAGNFIKLTNSTDDIISQNIISGIGTATACVNLGTATNSLVTKNNFRNKLTATSGLIYASGTCYDINNIGQTYSVVVPLTQAQVSNAGWVIDYTNYTLSWYSSGSAVGVLELSLPQLPINSIITSVDVEYQVNNALATQIEFLLYRYEITDSVGDGLDAISLSGTSSVRTSLNMFTSNYSVLYNRTYFLKCSVAESPDAKYLYGIKINYTL